MSRAASLRLILRWKRQRTFVVEDRPYDNRSSVDTPGSVPPERWATKRPRIAPGPDGQKRYIRSSASSFVFHQRPHFHLVPFAGTFHSVKLFELGNSVRWAGFEKRSRIIPVERLQSGGGLCSGILTGPAIRR
jgi:hypothetical protein